MKSCSKNLTRRLQTECKTSSHLIYMNIGHPMLPVKLEAAISISVLTKTSAFAQDFLIPALPNILKVFLKIMDEIDSPELVQALTRMMTAFRNKIAPFALNTVQQLVAHWQRLIQEEATDD